MRRRDRFVVFSQQWTGVTPSLRSVVFGAAFTVMMLVLIVFSQPLPSERFRDRTALWQRSG
jgi:type II secretory pathway component PulM